MTWCVCFLGSSPSSPLKVEFYDTSEKSCRQTGRIPRRSTSERIITCRRPIHGEDLDPAKQGFHISPVERMYRVRLSRASESEVRSWGSIPSRERSMGFPPLEKEIMDSKVPNCEGIC